MFKINIVNTILGAPLRWLFSAIPNFAICMIIYLIFVRLVYIVFDYFRAIQKVKIKLAKPFVAKIKDKFLGREGHMFEDATLELFKATGSNYFSSFLPFLVEYPVIIGLFFTLYHPISILFPEYRDLIPQLDIVAKGICEGNIQEVNIIRAFQLSPDSFAGFNLSGLQGFNSSIFGINIFETASVNSISVIFPAFALTWYLLGIVKMLIPVFTKQKKIRDIVIYLLLYIFVTVSMVSCAFVLPLIFYIYLFIFIILGSAAGKIIDNIIYKRKKEWVKTKNKECQEILKKYGVTEYVSAIAEVDKEEDVDA